MKFTFSSLQSFIGVSSKGDVVVLPERDWEVSLAVCGVGLVAVVFGTYIIPQALEKMYPIDSTGGEIPKTVSTIDGEALRNIFREFDTRAESYNALRSESLSIADPLR